MNTLTRILLVDDDEALKDEVVASFDGQKVDLVYCPTKDEAMAKIDSKQHFDLVILDWFLEDPENSNLSQLILKYLYGRLFVPVFIWSRHIDDFKSVSESGRINYPGMLIEAISKEEITSDAIMTKIQEWIDKSLTAQISRIYRNSITSNLEKIFFELADISNDDIASILKVIVGTEENIDWSNDFILNLLHRRLLVDNSFADRLRTLLVAKATVTGVEDLAKRRIIINKFLYYQSTQAGVRCGDIVKITKDSSIIKYGIIVTPDCDIEQKNTRYIELIELRKIEDGDLKLTDGQKGNIRGNNNSSMCYFPAVYIDGSFDNDFVAILKSKFIVMAVYETNTEKYPRIPAKLTYSARFKYNNEDVEIVQICCKSDPYKSDFLQKLCANNSRVGTPDIKDLLRQ